MIILGLKRLIYFKFTCSLDLQTNIWDYVSIFFYIFLDVSDVSILN